MSSRQQAQCTEAIAQLKQADKALTRRSFFRGTPDYLTAAPLLAKAGELFRLGGEFEASKDAFARCADAYAHNQSLVRAAQAWENVAKTAVQQATAERGRGTSALERTAEARKAYETASNLYADTGELGKAAETLVTGAQVCASHGGSTVDKVLPLYWQACDLVDAQDKPHFAVETFRKTLSFLVQHEHYKDALTLLDRMAALYAAMDQKHNVHKTQLSQVILHLATGDVPAADALYSRCLQDDSFLSSDDCALAEDLVRAFKMGNDELLQATVRKPGFLALDNQIGRICRKLSVYGAGDAAPSQPKRQQRPAALGKGSLHHHHQPQAKQRNPFAPSARAERAEQSPCASSGRKPAPTQASSLNSEYASSEAPTVSTTDAHDSDYEAALAEALGEVDVSTTKTTRSTPALVSQSPQPASPKCANLSFSFSPNMAPSPSPSLTAARTSARVNNEFDDLEFAMETSDSLEFSLSDSANAGTSGHSDSFEAATIPAPKAKAPVAKPAPKAAAPVYDEFDLT